ncbi:MAG TPA: NAD-dependent deacylase [Gemmataceae bacterium]|nr:NAD-dependent deacylase [Gemmataceae bacterium]
MHHPIHDGPDDALDRAAELLSSATEVAVLTGAGVSAESGLATFRGAGGLWEGQRVEEVATPSAFRRDPTLVWRFYNARRDNLCQAEPNPGHRALVALEERFGERFTLATQNVDGLHRAAGSRRVLELHGSLRRVRCTGCGAVADRGTEPLPDLPHCDGCGAMLRPDVVWFEEALPEDQWHEAKRAADRCDCFLVIGTSAVVYPAAGLIGSARYAGARVIEVNLERTEASRSADVGLYGRSGELLPRLVERLK